VIIGLSLATLIGLCLGLMGGGGSILTVPVLVYALGMEAKLSIALSLAIVGGTALIGSLGHWKSGNIHMKLALIFGPIAMVGTFIGAKLSVYFSSSTQLIIFAVVMLIAAVFMFKDKKNQKDEEGPKDKKELPLLLITIEGLIVGVLTGIVGVGGGFMIVPALVILGKVPMKQAVGTSLIIISMKSFAGFAGYATNIDIPWDFLGYFMVFTSIGILAGTYFVRFVPQKQLKKSFAVFLVVMGVFILYKNKEKMMVTSEQNNKSTPKVVSN
jgi:uncharacterized protein